MLEKEDYEEQCCLLETYTKEERIPIGRAIEKLDQYLNQKDLEGAARHLDYWLKEAQNCCDYDGCLAILNEQIGLFRKMEQKEKCFAAIDNTLNLLNTMNLHGTITLGTTYVNVATGYKAFGKDTTALSFYERAREIYEENLDPYDGKLAGLYNNMAVALIEEEEFSQSEELFLQALRIMEKQDQGALERAITYCNMADLKAKELGLECGRSFIEEYLTKAVELFEDKEVPRNGYYAFVCEKCGPVFGHYGYKAVEKEMMERAKEIYERS